MANPPLSVFNYPLKMGEPNPISFDAPIRMRVSTPDGLIIETIIAMNQHLVITTPADGGDTTLIQFIIEDGLMPKGPKLVRDETSAA